MQGVSSPYLYGLHPNAEIGFLSQTSEKLFRTVLEMQPRDGAAGEGGGATREEKVLANGGVRGVRGGAVAAAAVAAAVAVATAASGNCQQEPRRHRVSEEPRGKRGVAAVVAAVAVVAGELTMTGDMEELQNAIFLDVVPAGWTQRAYPSMSGLALWFTDLLARIKELEAWAADFCLPPAVWLAGFFNPQSFLTAIMQAMARSDLGFDSPPVIPSFFYHPVGGCSLTPPRLHFKGSRGW
ncbi:hypothetical protein CRUP_036781 [Coryphaenoides rupestris]|nr:hypothetical protein CRUP_036781 [Coryphaenoides rupestris]